MLIEVQGGDKRFGGFLLALIQWGCFALSCKGPIHSVPFYEEWCKILTSLVPYFFVFIQTLLLNFSGFFDRCFSHFHIDLSTLDIELLYSKILMALSILGGT